MNEESSFETSTPAVACIAIIAAFLFYQAFFGRTCLSGLLFNQCKRCPHVTFFEYITGQYHGDGGDLDAWGQTKEQGAAK